MTDWIYFATATKASLAATIETVLNTQFLWRSARNSKGASIANVAEISEGDVIVVAWRHSGSRRSAYLRCRVGTPLKPLEPGVVIERLSGTDSQPLIAAGYPATDSGDVEGIRLDEIEECSFEVKGTYGGNNAIHRLAEIDASQIDSASTIPPEALEERSKPARKEASLAHAVRTAFASTPFPTSEVDYIEQTDVADQRAFDAYAMVDWSSSSCPTSGNDSIWIGSGAWSGRAFSAGPPVNISTRAEAIDRLRKQLQQWRNESKRVLVGFDFAFGYPAGFARALRLPNTGGAWRDLHSHFATHVTDSPRNVHNRDAFADACNKAVGAPGPFWGCAGKGSLTLPKQRIGQFQFPHRGLEEWRATEVEARKQVTTQSVWKLNCGVSVGGQTIVGIKHLHELAVSVQGYRWPFDGWGTPREPAIWFAEIFPSLVRYPDWGDEYLRRRDRTQVQSCVRRAAERDALGQLKGDFGAPADRLDAATLSRVENEEGWILWV
jgi:hypothetical protein